MINVENRCAVQSVLYVCSWSCSSLCSKDCGVSLRHAAVMRARERERGEREREREEREREKREER